MAEKEKASKKSDAGANGQEGQDKTENEKEEEGSEETNAGIDMAIWHTSLTFPQIIATPVAGIMLDYFKKNSGTKEAYYAIFIVAIMYFLFGTCLVQKLTKIK